MPQRDMLFNSTLIKGMGNSITNSSDTIDKNSNNNRIFQNNKLVNPTILTDTSQDIAHPIIISSSPTNINMNTGNVVKDTINSKSNNNLNVKDNKNANNNYLSPEFLNAYVNKTKNIDPSSPIMIKQPPPAPSALNKFSFQNHVSPNFSSSNNNAYLSSTENVNTYFNSRSGQLSSSYPSDQSNYAKDAKRNSAISFSSGQLLLQDNNTNLLSSSYQPSSMTREVNSNMNTAKLSSSLNIKNTTTTTTTNSNGKKSKVWFTKGVPICENTMIKSQRMHRKRTMRLTKQAQNDVKLYYNFDINLLLQISVEQWVDFIAVTTFTLWQYPSIELSTHFMSNANEALMNSPIQEKSYFLSYRRFLYTFMVKTSPNPFVILHSIVYLYKLRECSPDEIATPRSEMFVYPVLIMLADKYIQDIHQLPAKYWALAAKMSTEDLILFQRKVMKYLGYSLFISYEETENVVSLIEQFLYEDMDLDHLNQDISSPSSSPSYPTPPFSQQSSLDGFAMFNDESRDETTTLEAKEAEKLLVQFKKVLKNQKEYLPKVVTSSSYSLTNKYKQIMERKRDEDYENSDDDDGMDGDDEGEDYPFVFEQGVMMEHQDSPAPIPSYGYNILGINMGTGMNVDDIGNDIGNANGINLNMKKNFNIVKSGSVGGKGKISLTPLSSSYPKIVNPDMSFSSTNPFINMNGTNGSSERIRRPSLNNTNDNRIRRPSLNNNNDNRIRRPSLNNTNDNRIRRPSLNNAININGFNNDNNPYSNNNYINRHPSAHEPYDRDFPNRRPSAHEPYDRDFPNRRPSAHEPYDRDFPNRRPSAHEPYDRDFPNRYPSAHEPYDRNFPKFFSYDSNLSYAVPDSSFPRHSVSLNSYPQKTYDATAPLFGRDSLELDTSYNTNTNKNKNSNGNKKVSMLTKAMNLLKRNNDDKNSKNKNKNSSNTSGNKSSKTLPRNYKSSKYNPISKGSPFPSMNSIASSGGGGNVLININGNTTKRVNGSTKRNSKVYSHNKRHSVGTTVSINSNNKRHSLPAYFNNFKFSDNNMDSFHSNPPEKPQKISIINKKINGSDTPDDYLFKDHSQKSDSPQPLLMAENNNNNNNHNHNHNHNKSISLKPNKRISKIYSHYRSHSTESADIMDEDLCENFNKSITYEDVTQIYNHGINNNDNNNNSNNDITILINDLNSNLQINNDLNKDNKEDYNSNSNFNFNFNSNSNSNDLANSSVKNNVNGKTAEEEKKEENKENKEIIDKKENSFIDYDNTVNLLKSMPFGDDALVKDFENNILQENNEEDVSEQLFNVSESTSEIGRKPSNKTPFLFSKKKNTIKSSYSPISEGTTPKKNNYKKHTKSASLFSGSNYFPFTTFDRSGKSHKKSQSMSKQIYTTSKDVDYNYQQNDTTSTPSSYKSSNSNSSKNENITSEKQKDQKQLKSILLTDKASPSVHIDPNINDNIKEGNNNNNNSSMNMNKNEMIKKSNSYPKRNNSKWFGRFMKSIQLKK